MKKLIAVIFAVTLIFTGCQAGSGDSGSTAGTEDTTTAAPVASTEALKPGDAYAVDKLDFKYMPDGWKIDGEDGNNMSISGPNCQLAISSVNYKDQLTSDLDKLADSGMASIKMSSMLMHMDLNYQQPKHITVATNKYDAVSYDYEMVVNQYNTDASGSVVTNADKSQQKTAIGTIDGKSVFFFSGQDAYSFVFTALDLKFNDRVVEFDKMMQELTVHEDYKAADTSARLTMMPPATSVSGSDTATAVPDSTTTAQ
jgi:hypothetical protein